MRSRWAVVLALIVSIWSQLPLDACGDKFLLVGRGVKFDRAYAALYPGRIVILATNRARATEGTASLRKVLAYAGHRVTLITSDELDATLRNGQTDIVIADRLQAPLIDPQLKPLSAGPTMLYVVMDKDRKQPGGVNAAFQVKQSDRPLRWLLVIDDAMQVRARSGTRVRG